MRLWIALVMLTIASPGYAQTTLGSSSGASSIVDISSPANTTNHLITAPTVAAPGLAAAGIETCLGSASGGLSLMGGGITFGSTKVDQGCTIRLLARQLFAFGLHKAAVALMCQDQRVAVAMEVAGSPCPAPPADGSEPVASIPANPALTAPQEVSESAFDPAPVPITRGGYILDLKHAEIDMPVQTPVYVASAPAAPVSPEEQAWFDRAANIN
jgi:hypothetical protein